MTLQQKVGRIGLVAGPLLALALYLWLPGTYVDAAGKVVPLAHAARATFAMMAWMATWWMTEATEIEVTSLLPIVAFPLLGVMPLAPFVAALTEPLLAPIRRVVPLIGNIDLSPLVALVLLRIGLHLTSYLIALLV